MKQGIHPENYRPVVFKDMSNGDSFLDEYLVSFCCYLIVNNILAVVLPLSKKG